MATPRFTVYDFDQVTVAFGPILMDGFQDGEGVTIEQDTDGFTKKIGADGKVTRSKTLNRSARVTIKLMQTSACNDLLSAVYNLDIAAPNGAGVGPLYIRDRNGRSVFSAAEAWIAKAPDVTFDREATAREWIIDCAVLDQFHGGN